MKRRFLLASLLGLLTPGVGLAQSGGRPPGGGPGGDRPGGGHGGGRPGETKPGGGHGGNRPSPDPRPPRPPRPSRPPPRPQPLPGPYRPGAGRPPGFRPIRGPRWRYPPGYRYRRWAVGAVLPAFFLAPTYYYDDYWRMGLGGPPWGYRWVRYGPDLLLVEMRSGRIVDVIYGAFY